MGNSMRNRIRKFNKRYQFFGNLFSRCMCVCIHFVNIRNDRQKAIDRLIDTNACIYWWLCWVFSFLPQRKLKVNEGNSPNDWELRSFICSHISTATAMPATTMANMWNVNFCYKETNRTVNEMKSVRKLFPFLSVVCVCVCALTITKYTNTHIQIGRHCSIGWLRVCVRHLIVSLFILIWFEHVIVADAVSTDAAVDPTHLRHTLISTNVLSICFKRQSPEYMQANQPAWYHKRKIMPTYSLVHLRDV